MLAPLTSRWNALCPWVRFCVIRWVGAFFVVAFLLTGYGVLTSYNLHRFETGGDYWTLWTAWDRAVPTVVWTFWLYLLYYPVVFAPVFLVENRKQLVEVFAAYIAVTVTAWLAFITIPIRMEYPELACTGISCDMVRDLYALDGGVNIFPSLHAAHSALVAAAFWSYRNRLAPLMTVVALLISVSAVLTRQHYIIDIPLGIALGVAGWLLVRRAVSRVMADEGSIAVRVRAGVVG